MNLLLATILVAGAPAVPGSPPFATFDQVCASAVTVEQAYQAAEAAGWVAFEPDADSPLGYIVNITRRLGGKVDRPFRSEAASHFVWIRETIPAPVGTFVECKVYDFSTTTLPATDLLTRWAGRAPDDQYSVPGGSDAVVMWFDDATHSTSVSVQTPPCFTRPCPEPRLVIERSALKPS